MYTTAKRSILHMTIAKNLILHVTMSYEEIELFTVVDLHSKNTNEFNIHMTKLYPRKYTH